MSATSDAAVAQMLRENGFDPADMDASLHELAQQYLADFDYPTDEGKEVAIKKLADAIDTAANQWIEANCAF